MIEVGVVDLSADGRRRLAALVERWSWVNPDAKQTSLPRLSLHHLSPEEVRFHGDLDICLIGSELILRDTAFVGTLRRQIPDKILICVLDARAYSIGMVEQLARLEVDDVLMDSSSGEEFFRRLILLKRRVGRRNRGKLVVVDGARGGVGVTFVAAGIAGALVNDGIGTCIVDTDTNSQDLTRFLQCRPFLNEPLKVLLDQQRNVSSETVAECVYPVWPDEPGFVCMPPPAGADESVYSSPLACRTVVSVAECLLNSYDSVVIDASSMALRGRQALYQIADRVIFVLNRDPAAAYASRNSLALISGNMRPEASLTAVINDGPGRKAAVAALRDGLAASSDRQFECVHLPFSARSGRWACSGYTPERYLRRTFERLIAQGDISANQTESTSPVFNAAKVQMNRLISGLWNAIRHGGSTRRGKIDPGVMCAQPLFQEGRHPTFPTRQLAIPDPCTEAGLVSRPILSGE